MNKTTERLVLGGVALLLGLLLGWMVRGATTYNTATETDTAYQDWQVICPPAQTKDASCVMQDDVVDSKIKATVARITITKDPKQGQVIAFTLPYDVLLDPGVGLKVGSKEQAKPYKYRTCNNVGCIAVTPVDDTFINSLGTTDEVDLLFIGSQPDAKTQTLPVSLKGFTVARRAYLRENAKRQSWFWRLWS